MTSQPNQPFPAPMPIPADNPDGPTGPTREVDGEELLDPDLDGSMVDSAEADAIASGADKKD